MNMMSNGTPKRHGRASLVPAMRDALRSVVRLRRPGRDGAVATAWSIKMTRYALAFILVLLASGASAGERLKLTAVWCGAKSADLITTELALSRGGYESNPLMRDRYVRYGAGVGSCVLAAEADHKLRHHKKSRWALRVLGIGLMGYAVQRNARVR